MGIKIDQKVMATIGLALGGALAALAASPGVPPQVAAYAGVGIVILTALGVYHAPVPQAKQDAIVAANTSADTGPIPPPVTSNTAATTNPQPPGTAISTPRLQPPPTKPFRLP